MTATRFTQEWYLRLLEAAVMERESWREAYRTGDAERPYMELNVARYQRLVEWLRARVLASS